MPDELLERYKCDHDRGTLERLVESHRPLVWSVCRRMLRDPHDLEDVVQETFLKLTNHVGAVNGSVAAWLSATAQTTSTDFIRRAIRERNRRRGLAHAGPSRVERLALHEAIRLRLYDAMRILEPEMRELLNERVVRKTPLGVLAIRMKTSVPTASRRVAQAVRQLASILRDLGVPAADDRTVSGFVGDANALSELDESDHGDLRFAPDWHSAELTPLGAAPTMTLIPGWTRPMRVGVLVSYQSTLTLGVNNVYVGTKWQVHSSAFLPNSGLQLVAVVEPGTVHRGIIESTVRDHSLLGGLIEADDVSALQTLDVLLLGINYCMSNSVARAINKAVRGGVGLLNEYWTGSQFGTTDDVAKLELMLADSKVFKYHMPGECGEPLPATVTQEHPLLPGLRAGETIMIRGCGPCYSVMPGARVLLTKDYVVQPEAHGIGGLGPARMPCYILGQLGRGRVAVIHTWPHQWFIRHLSVGPQEYFLNLLGWLAGSKRDGG